MDTLDRQVLTQALAWRRAGHSATLVTVVQTWGSAPRPVGALLALRGDGVPGGSGSGGCVEDDLIDRLRRGGPPQLPQVLTPDSLARARAAGRGGAADLADNDAYGFFQAIGDLLVTGPTMTNVNDFRAVLVL